MTRDLRGTEVHHYELSATEDLLVVVENRGRGTILSIADIAGTVRFRTANWRQVEGMHTAVLESGERVVLSIEPDEPLTPPGQYRISVRQIERDGREFAAERHMMFGANARLRHYYGESDGRADALEQFRQAAEAFAEAGDEPRRADALFEAAGVYLSFGEHDEAADTYALAAELWSAAGDSRGMATAEVHLGLIDWRTNRLNRAITRFRNAAEWRRTFGDRYFEAQALNNIGLVQRDLGDARRAIANFEAALTIWQGDADLMNVDVSVVEFGAMGRPPWLADSLIAMNNLAWAHDLVADTANAERVLTQGLALSQLLGRHRNEAEILNNLGRLKYRTGELQQSLDYLDRAIAYFESTERNEIWAGNALQTRSQVFRATGDLVRAEHDLRAALDYRTEERDPIRRAETLLALGELGLEARDPSASLPQIVAALALLGKHGDSPRLRAAAHNLAGRAYRVSGRYRDALRRHDQSVELYSTSEDIRGEAGARSERALTRALSGDTVQALADLDWSIDHARSIEDQLLLFGSLTNKATVYAGDSQWDLSTTTAVAALSLSETVRQGIADPILLRFFSAIQRDAYEALVTSTLAQRNVPGAWRAANESRARRFAELLGAGRRGPEAIDAAQKQQYTTLVQMRAARAEELTRLLAIAIRPAPRATDNSVRQLRTELADIVRRIEMFHETVPADDLASSRVADLHAVQAALAKDELMLEYFIGDSAGWVWRISRDDIKVETVPEPATLASRIDDIVDTVRQHQAVPHDSLSKLAAQLLPGTAARLTGTRHLVVVPDGPLYSLPFSLLPHPGSHSGESLVVQMDISYLPSAAMLMVAAGEGVGSRLAIIADPVFAANDMRLRPGAAASAFPPDNVILDRELTRSAARNEMDLFPRLPGTRMEADVIRTAATGADIFVAMDTDANRELVLSGFLNHFDVIHFATHGILDASEPALSGIVLSGVNKNGGAIPRFLRSQDVSTLTLDADLIVLSGCETGLGRVVDSEGVVGLSQAFFRAGARQVVSSLWRISDRATAELMQNFYRAMYEQGHSPVAALRIAQQSMHDSRRWHDPYYWAGFVLQGDWH